MKRDALLEASMSSAPAFTAGWLAITPTVRPFTRAEPDDVLREAALHLEEIAEAHHRQITLRTSYAFLPSTGTISSSAGLAETASAFTCGGSSILFSSGRKLSSFWHNATACWSVSAMKWITPNSPCAPPCSAVTVSPVPV